MNRKGDFAEGFVEFASIPVIVMVLVGFWFILINVPKEKNKELITDFKLNQERLTLLNLLKTPISMDFNNDGTIDDGNMADLVVFSYKKNDFNDFNRISKEKINQLFTNTKCAWSINVFQNGNQIDSVLSGNNNIFSRNFISNATIPVDEKTTVTIFYVDNLMHHENGDC